MVERNSSSNRSGINSATRLTVTNYLDKWVKISKTHDIAKQKKNSPIYRGK